MVRMSRTQGKWWRGERLGLTMIVAALSVAVLATVMLFHYAHELRRDRARTQAIGLTRLLAEIPLSQLAPVEGRSNIIRALYRGESQSDFAYASIRDLNGRTLSEVASPGVTVPAFAPVSERDWLRQRELLLDDGSPLFEVQAPLFSDGEQAGSITLAVQLGSPGWNREQLPMLASVVLVIFLLAPISHFAMRREIRRLRQATEDIGKALAGFEAPVMQPSGELSEFMQSFSLFMREAHSRIAMLENDNASMLTSTKLISYRKARVESVLESLPEALIVLDESGAVSFANARIKAMFGVNPSELQGANDLSWCPDVRVCRFLSRCSQSHSGGYVADAVQFELEALPGKTFSVSAYPLFAPHEGSQTLGTLVVFRDVTVETLARRSRGEFVAHVAHELKTPLNVLGMYSEVLLDSGGADESQRVECINVIRDEIERLASLVRNLLNLTQIEMGSLQPTLGRSRVHDLVTDVFAQIRDGHAESNVHFEIAIPRELGAANVDKDLMRVALTNLLTNAIKYNHPEGTVRLAAEETDEAILIRVGDDGIGISKSDQAHIFDKFYRSENDEVRERSGHGLGLSLARDIVQLHGGELTVTSTPGEGSEFVVTLWKDLVSKAS